MDALKGTYSGLKISLGFNLSSPLQVLGGRGGPRNMFASMETNHDGRNWCIMIVDFRILPLKRAVFVTPLQGVNLWTPSPSNSVMPILEVIYYYEGQFEHYDSSFMWGFGRGQCHKIMEVVAKLHTILMGSLCNTRGLTQIGLARYILSIKVWIPLYHLHALVYCYGTWLLPMYWR